VNSLVGLEINNLNDVQIFPNPSNGQFFIASPALQAAVLYNQFGQQVAMELMPISEGRYQVLTNDLANGSYILELQSQDAVVRKAIQLIK
jgi:hypothetical protein